MGGSGAIIFALNGVARHKQNSPSHSEPTTVLTFLIKHNVDVNEHNEVNRIRGHGTNITCSALWYACFFGLFENAKLLLEAGADADVPSGPHNRLPLHEACILARPRIVSLLLEHSGNNERYWSSTNIGKLRHWRLQTIQFEQVML